MASAPICANHVSGLLSQLAAKGPQNQMLDCAAEMTFFSQAYARHTNFAMGEQDITFNNAPSGAWTDTKCVSAEIQRSGDLLTELFFTCQLTALPVPAAASSDNLDVHVWTPAVGFAMMERVRLNIGSQQIEEIYDTYMMMDDEVHKTEGKRQGMAVGDYGLYLRGGVSAALAGGVVESISPGRADEDTIQRGIDFSTRTENLHVNIPFHFHDNVAGALNVVGLQYHQIQVEIDFRGRDSLVKRGSLNRLTGGWTDAALSTLDTGVGEMKYARLRAIFVHLDKAERRVRAQQPSQVIYVYGQHQIIPVAAADKAATKEVRNYFNHPVTDLLWAYRSNANLAAKEYFNFGAYSANKNILYTPSTNTAAVKYLSPQEVVDPIDTVELLLNNHSRFSGKAEYFKETVPRMRSSRVPSRVIGQYAFALMPSDKSRPSGHLNLSRIDNIILKFLFRDAITSSGTPSRDAVTALVPELRVAAASANLTPKAFDLSGNIYFHARTINSYKQAHGMIGVLFAN